MHRLAFVTAFLIATPALADRRTPGVQEDEINRPSEIEPSVAAGDMLPFTTGARHDRQGILIGSYGGFDATKRTPIMQGLLEATFIENITLRAMASNPGMSDQLQPSFGILVDILREDATGIDVAIGADYELTGWARVPAIVPRAALGTTLGLTRLQVNAGFGLGLEAGEQYGDLRLSALRPVAQALYAGFDSRARIDISRNDMTETSSTGGLDYDVQAGPMLSLAVGRFAISATGGVSTWKTRMGENPKIGAMGALGLGAAF